MIPTRTNITNAPDTHARTDLIEIGTPDHTARLWGSGVRDTVYLLHMHVGSRHTLFLAQGRTPEAAAIGLGASIAGTLIKWRTDKGEDCPIENPTIDTLLSHANP